VDPYTSSHYTSHHDTHPLHTRSQNAYHQTMANVRSRSSHDIIHSMLTPVLPDVSRRSPPNTTSATSHERVSWERSGIQGNLPSPLQGLGSDSGSDSFQWSPNSDSQFMNFDAQTWNDALASPMSASNMHSYFPSQPYKFSSETSSVPSPPPYSGVMSSYPDVKRQVSPASSSSSRQESRRGSLDSSGGGKSCSHCHATSTPLWRREPTTLKPLCNACGLYLQQRNKHRPQELIDADAAADDSSDESEGDGTGPECSHCRTHRTSVWRRSKTGAQLCNACGVYSRLRGRDRPLSLKRNRIKPRSKHTPTPK
jgi:GATA-binding protein 2